MASRRLTAGVGDYEQYRHFRVAPTEFEKLGAAAHYLQEQPRGKWRYEVDAWFKPAEQSYLVRIWSNLPALTDYLSKLPETDRKQQVRARIQQLHAERREQAENDKAFIEQERQRRERLDQAQKDRQDFLLQLSNWTARLSTGEDLGKSLPELSRELREAYFRTAPEGSCSSELCQKTLLFNFDIPIGQRLQGRPASVTIELKFEAGLLEQATIEAPHLFDRIGEAATLRPVLPNDLQARAEAVATSVQVLGLALHTGFGSDACNAEAISPTVLAKACNGRRAELQMGLESEDFGLGPDRLIIWRTAGVPNTSAISP